MNGTQAVVVFGSSGVIGQHMRLCVPGGITPMWMRRETDYVHRGLDLNDFDAVTEFLNSERPQIVINLAGECSTDTVEREPERYRKINVELPRLLAGWCQGDGRHYIHVSSQAVFSGDNPPYSADSPLDPINKYGCQKAEAEAAVVAAGGSSLIIRPTFVLGVCPMPHIGRSNPLESMLRGQLCQVHDRRFSVAFARDAARQIWECAVKRLTGVVHIGINGSASRYDVAVKAGCKATAVSHDSFPGIAPRPMNTAYGSAHPYTGELDAGMAQCLQDWSDKDALTVRERAREISLFLGTSEAGALGRLLLGFGDAHARVAVDYRRANPETTEQILQWYRQTSSYIWELSAYHLDPGFNYAGMCKGICDRLEIIPATKVLCLGDGIGDMTMYFRKRGLDAWYNDLGNSMTSMFAKFRYWMHTGEYLPTEMNTGWELQIANKYDAIVACDILEHVTDVRGWMERAKGALRPGGWLMAQNAFGAGSGHDGSIPMHLACNDRFEKEWDPMLASIGFRQESSNWYQLI